MNLRTIIVDDVKLAREHVRNLLNGSEIEVVAECENGREAVKTIRKLTPDLVFLDVQMPGVNGFEVIEEVGVERMPAVIFTTAYDEFALRAFDVNAVDYLLKPFDLERLRKAVDRARKQIVKQEPSAEIEAKLRKLLVEVNTGPQYLKRLPVKSSRGTVLVSTEEIDWIGSAGHYIELHVGRDTYLLRETLSRIEQQLDPAKFVRIHRSTIVNLERIESLHPLFNGDHLVILKNGVELNLSRTYHETLMSRLVR